jgi:hypothetical protein
MWEVWLKSDQIAKRHVKRAEKKHRFIMYLLQKTANRQAGMGLKLTKFHAIVHMATDSHVAFWCAHVLRHGFQRSRS